MDLLTQNKGSSPKHGHGCVDFFQLDYINVPVQHMQAIYGDAMPYSYDIQLGIFYMHYHTEKITHNTAFGEQVGGIGGSKLVTRRQQVNCQSKQNGGGVNHQPTDY